MTRSIIILLTTAVADLAEAKEWYRQCHPYLGAELILCVEETLERIIRHPLSFASLNGESSAKPSFTAFRTASSFDWLRT